MVFSHARRRDLRGETGGRACCLPGAAGQLPQEAEQGGTSPVTRGRTRGRGREQVARRVEGSRAALVPVYPSCVGNVGSLVAGGCSTPRGITATATPCPTPLCAAFSRCSTPRGITATATSTATRTPTWRTRGAQRLAASQRRRPRSGQDGQALTSECSTPRGITATATPAMSTTSQANTGCSTPRGITATATWRNRQPSRARRGAQRLAASQRRRLGAKDEAAIVSRCSTPRGITATATSRRELKRRLLVACSTPRGITATATSPDSYTMLASILCSTPRGITATATGRSGVRDDPDARVLNASRHHSDGDSAARALGQVLATCSTPRGITATATNSIVYNGTVDLECSTPRGITATATVHHAQPPRTPRGAQRLAASQRRRLWSAGKDSTCLAVLNASRHHSDGDAILRLCARPQQHVLNASRHHSDGDGTQPCLHTITTLCSTPRGITATATRPTIACRALSGVLNASRHHSDGDSARGRRARRPRTCAQRLAASQRRRQRPACRS